MWTHYHFNTEKRMRISFLNSQTLINFLKTKTKWPEFCGAITFNRNNSILKCQLTNCCIESNSRSHSRIEPGSLIKSGHRNGQNCDRTESVSGILFGIESWRSIDNNYWLQTWIGVSWCVLGNCYKCQVCWRWRIGTWRCWLMTVLPGRLVIGSAVSRTAPSTSSRPIGRWVWRCITNICSDVLTW